MRRNVDLTYIVMDNQIYGLTTGQVSPTRRKGMKTKSTPNGSVENLVNPITLAIVSGATYVARGFSGQQKHLVVLIRGAIEHRGFAFVDVFSPSGSSTRRTACPRWTSWSRCLPRAARSPAGHSTYQRRTRARS
jgi:pyruvate/2-oxoacid:ferredoxin oxidoreductase beta subunit